MKIHLEHGLTYILFFSLAMIQAQGDSEWEVAKEEKGVEISYRWLTTSDGSKAREMRAIFEVSAGVAEIVKLFRDPFKYQEWQPAIEECSIKLLADNRWDTYMKFNLPWPFKSKDLVTRTNFLKAEDYSTINILSTPNATAEFKNVKRINDLEAEWKLVPIGTRSTKVIYTTITYDKPEFPRIIADPILQNKLIESIGLLKLLATR